MPDLLCGRGAGIYNEATMGKRDNILLKDINHKLDAILEGQAAMAHVPLQIERLQIDMTEVKGDMRVIKIVLKDHSKDIAELKQAVA